jgi:macrolide transport system ATP-binding/permease protein
MSSGSSAPVFHSSALAPLRATDIAKAYGDRVVLNGVDLLAHPGQPVGLVGENGVGKSTLLRVVTGQESADAGSVSLPEDVGVLSREPQFAIGATIGDVLDRALAPLHEGVRRLESLAEQLQDDDPAAGHAYAEALEWAQHHDAWDADRRAEVACARLGLGTVGRDRLVDQLSGGQRSRLALAALIVRRPDCVILDEPTNHLDEQAIEFLESFLTGLDGVVVVASHDRVFLDHVCSVIVDLDASHFGVDGDGSNRYAGGFTDYLEHKRLARRRWEQAFVSQQDELDALRQATRTTARSVSPHNRPPRDNDKYLYHFKGENVAATISRRVRNAEARIDAIERDRVPKPPRALSFDRALTGESRHQGLAVSVRHLSVTGRLRLDRLDLSVGEHLLVTGDNGSGKSTLLHVLAGTLQPDAGTATVSARRIGRLAQDVVFPDSEQSPHEVFAAATGVDAPVALGELGLLHPRDLGRPVGRLSVGQQRRLALAILVAGQPDLLLLDEPTNHISLVLASELEEALGRTPGTVVIASHDRWLRERWTGRTLDLEGVSE